MWERRVTGLLEGFAGEGFEGGRGVYMARSRQRAFQARGVALSESLEARKGSECSGSRKGVAAEAKCTARGMERSRRGAERQVRKDDKSI